jgi:hypothetical protein
LTLGADVEQLSSQVPGKGVHERPQPGSGESLGGGLFSVPRRRGRADHWRAEHLVVAVRNAFDGDGRLPRSLGISQNNSALTRLLGFCLAEYYREPPRARILEIASVDPRPTHT